ncbi:hypothetical protein BES34_009485 [Leptospira inadai serovar Lyme]|nr:hypothetical protein BES34_009485 [Leptospira inadai serovar Lyme]
MYRITFFIKESLDIFIFTMKRFLTCVPRVIQIKESIGYFLMTSLYSGIMMYRITFFIKESLDIFVFQMKCILTCITRVMQIKKVLTIA